MTRQSRPVRAIPIAVVPQKPAPPVSAGSWWTNCPPDRFTATATQHETRMLASKEGKAALGMLLADDLTMDRRSRGTR